MSTDDGKKLVGRYEDRGSFGELALMYNMPRAATIQAMSDGSLWAMVGGRCYNAATKTVRIC